MPTLYLLRHCKAVTGEPETNDFGRKLSARGQREGEAIGAIIGRKEPKPRLALCSPSRRTVDTLALVVPQLGADIEVRYAHRLYLADAAALLEIIHELEGAREALLLVGHNPGLEQLALDLTRQADRGGAAYRAMREKFPTAGLAILDMEGSCWESVRHGRLLNFATPKGEIA